MNFQLLTNQPRANVLVEWEMPVPAAACEKNPYRAEEVACLLTLQLNDITRCVSGFYYEEYGVDAEGRVKPKAAVSPTFRFRSTLPQAGLWNYTLTVKIDSNVAETSAGTVEIEESHTPSAALQIEPIRKQNFANQAGEPVVLFGQNMESLNGVPAADFGKTTAATMRELQKHGGNYLYVYDNTFNCSRIKAKVNQMRQDVCAMWDYIFETAEQTGVYLHFALLNQNELRALFPKSVWHKDQGGFIDDPCAFFEDIETKAAVKNYLRYVVSRWGYSQHLLGWELVHCADCNASFALGKIPPVQAWLAEMLACVRETDAHKHLCSLSVCFPSTLPALYHGFDFLGYPQKNYSGVGQIAEMQKHVTRAYGCPALIIRTGIYSETAMCAGGVFPEDLAPFHQQNWAGVMGGGAGTAMNGEWREAEAIDAMRDFKPLQEFAQQIPWRDPSLQSVTINAFLPKNGRIGVQGYRCDTGAYLWFFDLLYLPIDRSKEIVFEEEPLSFAMPNGEYRVCWYDTRTGETVQKTTLSVTDGKASLVMPDWSKDIALAITAQ